MPRGILNNGIGGIGPSPLARVRASWIGRRDGLNRLPTVTVELSDDGRLLPPEPTFRQHVQELVHEAGERLYAEFLGRNARLRQEIHGTAYRLVESQESSTDRGSEHQRFTAALSRWTTAVQAQYPRAEAFTHRGNALLAHYWHAVERFHPVFHDFDYRAELALMIANRNQSRFPQLSPHLVPLPDASWKPAPLTPDPRWSDPLELLILPDAPTSSTGPLRQAIHLITEPAPA